MLMRPQAMVRPSLILTTWCQYESILVKRSQILITWCQYGSILVKDSLALITWCQSRQCGKRSWRGLQQHGPWSGPIIQSVWEEVLAWPRAAQTLEWSNVLQRIAQKIKTIKSRDGTKEPKKHDPCRRTQEPTLVNNTRKALRLMREAKRTVTPQGKHSGR